MYKWVALLVLLPFQATALEAWFLVKQGHRSNILVGNPFYDRVPTEQTEDYFGLGATLAWKNFEIDVTHGWVSRDCGYYSSGCDWKSGTELTTRWYPLRSKKGQR